MRDVDLLGAARNFGAAVIARELLGDVVRVLGASGIDVMPIKGVLLHQVVYSDAATRPLKDVDVAVRSPDFDVARRALVAAGFAEVREEGRGYEVALRCDRFPLSVDLHRAFAATRRFRLTPDAMFARGRRDVAVFGFPVMLPDDYDIYAHLLAHAVLDYVAGGDWHHPDDLSLLVRARELTPQGRASRLDEHGLGRFARLALAPDTPIGSHSGSAAVVSLLKRDRVGELIVRLWRALPNTGRTPSVLRRALAVLLNPTLGDAGAAVVEAAGMRLVRRGRRH